MVVIPLIVGLFRLVAAHQSRYFIAWMTWCENIQTDNLISQVLTSTTTYSTFFGKHVDSIGESETLNVVNVNGHNGCCGVRDWGDGGSVKGGIGEKTLPKLLQTFFWNCLRDKPETCSSFWWPSPKRPILFAGDGQDLSWLENLIVVITIQSSALYGDSF